MIFRSTLALCPSCSCHARVEEPSCPHCGAPLRRSAGVATPRSAEAIAVGLTLAVALPVAACGPDIDAPTPRTDGAFYEATGGEGGASPRPTPAGGDGGGSVATSSWSSTSGETGELAAQMVSTYGSGPTTKICDSGIATGDGNLDECLGANCCAEFNACSKQGADPWGCMDCLQAGGGARCDPALACAREACAVSTGICDSGLTTGDDATDQCLGAACCDEYNACTSNGADLGACIGCFEDGSGPLCDAAIACMSEAGCGAFSICDSGLSTGDPEQNGCLTDACCDAFRACTTDGTDVDACITCLEEGGGPLCDAAIACEEEACP